jgi:hypothetical protein
MADTVDTAASLSPADEPAKPLDAAPADEPAKPQEAAPPDAPEESEDARSDSRDDQAEQEEEGAEKPEDDQSLTELVEQLAGDLSELGKSEAQLEAARNMPEVRQSARDVAGALVVVVAALTAFAFLNVAAANGLSMVMATWLAALILAAVWIAVAGVLSFGLMGRSRRWLWWIVHKEPPKKALEELEQERDAAAKAARHTIEQLGPALLIRIALAAVPDAGDVADGVVEVGDDVIEASEEIVAEFTEEMPGGGAARQVWSVALMPGRLGIRVATTVLRRRRPAD